MKKSIIFLLILFPTLLNAREDWDYKNYFRSDSAYNYSWDASLNKWILNSSQVYNYNSERKLNSVIVKSLPARTNLSKSEYEYDGNGLLANQTFFTWNNSWIPYSRNLISYDENGQTYEIIVQVLKGNEWSNNRWQKNYKYDLEGKLTEFQMIYWINNAWSLPTTDYSTYDETGKLIKRQAIYPNGNTDYQILYNYDENGLRSETYAQYPSGTGWINWWMNNYQYDNCGRQTTTIQYKGVLTDWILQSKTVSFNSFNIESFLGKKMPVCHNGHTIYISKNALKAHLAHGDCIGECTVEKEQGRRDFEKEKEHERPPFTIYPNPATEKITVKFDNDECVGSKRVELTDFYGKLIKSYNIKDNSDLTIYRNNLLSGKYCIRLIGEEVYSTVVIFQEE